MSTSVTSSLPGFVDSVLQDIAQSFMTTDGKSISYGDIIAFGKVVTKEELKEVKNCCILIRDGFYDWDNDMKVYQVAANLVDIVQSSIHKGA